MKLMTCFLVPTAWFFIDEEGYIIMNLDFTDRLVALPHPILAYFGILLTVALVELGYCVFAIRFPKLNKTNWCLAFIVVMIIVLLYPLGLLVTYKPVHEIQFWSQDFRNGVLMLFLAVTIGIEGIAVPYGCNYVMYRFRLAPGYDNDKDGHFRQTNLSWLPLRGTAFMVGILSLMGWLMVAVESHGFAFLPHWLDVTIKFLLAVLAIWYSFWFAYNLHRLNTRAYAWTRPGDVIRKSDV